MDVDSLGYHRLRALSPSALDCRRPGSTSPTSDSSASKRGEPCSVSREAHTAPRLSSSTRVVSPWRRGRGVVSTPQVTKLKRNQSQRMGTYDTSMDLQHWGDSIATRLGDVQGDEERQKVNVFNECQLHGCGPLHYCSLRPAQRVILADAFARTVSKRQNRKKKRAAAKKPLLASEIAKEHAIAKRGSLPHGMFPSDERWAMSHTGWAASPAFKAATGAHDLNRIMLSSQGLRFTGSGSNMYPHRRDAISGLPTNDCRARSSVGDPGAKITVPSYIKDSK